MSKKEYESLCDYIRNSLDPAEIKRESDQFDMKWWEVMLERQRHILWKLQKASESGRITKMEKHKAWVLESDLIAVADEHFHEEAKKNAD